MRQFQIRHTLYFHKPVGEARVTRVTFQQLNPIGVPSGWQVGCPPAGYNFEKSEWMGLSVFFDEMQQQSQPTLNCVFFYVSGNF